MVAELFLKFYNLHSQVELTVVDMVSYCGGKSRRSKGLGGGNDVRLVRFMMEVQL